MRKLFKWVLSLFKKRKRFEPSQYHKDKHKTVVHKGTKLKVRQFIGKMANQMDEINYKGYGFNRECLISNYNKGGFDSVKKYCMSQVDIYVDNNSK